MKRIFSLIMLALWYVTALAANDTDSTRILFIGNSFTYVHDMPVALQKLAASTGDSLKLNIAFTKFTPGGCTLKRHCKNPELFKAIANGGWDYVVIQEQSSAPAMHSAVVAKETYPYARMLATLAKLTNPDAKIIFYMTWAHQHGCQDEHKGYPLIDTYERMQSRLITSYLEMTYDNDAWCAPVGMAWWRIRDEHPDYAIHSVDSCHPTKLGSYLAANVILSTILQTPYQSGYYAEFAPDVCKYIQSVAQQTVLDNLQLLNIKP